MHPRDSPEAATYMSHLDMPADMLADIFMTFCKYSKVARDALLEYWLVLSAEAS